MTGEELKAKGAIYFSKIDEGFSNYKSVTLKMDAAKAQKHFRSLRKEYGADNCFADFYYFNLDPDAQEMVRELLTPEDTAYLELIRPLDNVSGELIFPLDEKLLKIIVKLNAEEMLFSTIFFLNGKNGRARTTWWGNYDREYVCFKD